MLIVINNWKRAEILAKTLSRVKEVKHADSKIGIVDDCTPDWVAPEADHIWRASEHLGVGLARRFALERCLDTDHDLFLVMDNDMLVEPGFDTAAVELWLAYRSRHKGCLASPFRPDITEHRDREIDFGPYVFGTSSSGAMLCFDRPMIDFVRRRIAMYLWTDVWDWVLGGFVNGFIKTERSYATHIGDDADALHPAVKPNICQVIDL